MTTTKEPEITFDKQANSFYIKIKEGNVIETKPYANCVVTFDIDTQGEILGVEIILRDKGVK